MGQNPASKYTPEFRRETADYVIASGRPHGPVAVAFTPDEETGLGIAGFDVEGFGAAYAYTVDGGEVGELSYENFNACEATLDFRGVNVHPGSAKDTMVNASLLAMEYNAMLPSAETPRHTEGYEGFFHLEEMEGDVAHARLVYIVRDHDAGRFEARRDQLRHIAKVMNERWGEGAVALTLRDQYRNMKEKIAPRCGRARFGLGALRNATVPVRNAIPAITNEGRCANTGLRWLWGTVTGIPSFSGRKEPFRTSRIFYCYTKDTWKRCRSPVRTGACGRRVRGPC